MSMRKNSKSTKLMYGTLMLSTPTFYRSPTTKEFQYQALTHELTVPCRRVTGSPSFLTELECSRCKSPMRCMTTVNIRFSIIVERRRPWRTSKVRQVLRLGKRQREEPVWVAIGRIVGTSPTVLMNFSEYRLGIVLFLITGQIC